MAALHMPAGAEAPPCRAEPGMAPEMVLVRAGRFDMGSPATDTEASADERPKHEVMIVRPFAIGRCEVTKGEFRVFAEQLDAQAPPLDSDGRWDVPSDSEDHPVRYVSWNDAVRYTEWLSRMTGYDYRLPTEAEWEYAARGGTTTPYWWGNAAGDGCKYANSIGCLAEAGPLAVATLEPNDFGLYDMAGNVFEWVADCWHNNYDNAPQNGVAWLQSEETACSGRVLRGGSWSDGPDDSRSATRYRVAPEDAYVVVGFRLARTL